MAGILRAFAGMTVEEYAAAADEFMHYLEANGITAYIASGGDRDFMRPVTQEMYGIPSERVIGSSNALNYQDDEHGGTVVYLAQPDVFDYTAGAEKSLEQAHHEGWTVVSIKNDWATVFPDA